jgi:putative CocE/NonD family hydrolase
MRDGVRLCTNVFRPPVKGRVPALLVRTPYGKGTALAATYQPFLKAGYAVVVQDVRGRGDSEGVFRPLEQEVQDGYDTLAWIASQSWSNQRIGMLGASYLGIAQWKAALSGSPYLRAISPAVAGCDEFEDRFYSQGGAMKLGHRLSWMAANLRLPQIPEPKFEEYVRHLPLRSADRAATGREIDFWQAALNHPVYDDYWKAISTREQIGRVKAAALIIAGWYDNFAENDLEAFRLLRSLGREARIVVGPWPHNVPSTFPGFDFGPEANAPIRRMQLEWFDRWVKGETTAPAGSAKAGAQLFLMGANRWKEAEGWPPRSEPLRLFLWGNGRLSQAAPPKRSRPDSFVYDPRDPVPTLGGAVCCNPKIFPWGPMDQRALEKRKDVLVYTSAPLEADL